MKSLRIIGILVLVAGLVLGGAGSALAKGPPDGPPGGGSHSPGKRGLFGTVSLVETTIEGEEYVIHLETKLGAVDLTINGTAKYMVPRETHGPKLLDTFLGIVDLNEDDNLEELVGRRLAVLVILANEFTADAIRLMLIPSPDAPPLHAHRVGVVKTFVAGAGGSIEIIDRHGVSHPFDVDEYTIYRPAEIDDTDVVEGESFVTVVIKGDPKVGVLAKAIVLHGEIPERWPLP